MIKVLIADDHQMLAEGLQALLAEEPGIMILGTCANGEQVLHRLSDTQVDVLLLDINMPRLNGIQVMEYITVHHRYCKVIAISMYRQPSYVNRMLNLGAKGYILKDDSTHMIVEAIHKVSAGETYISEDVQRILHNQKELKASIPAITTREKEVLQLVADGLTTRQIAEQLYISNNTVQTHRRHLIEKFSAANSTTMINMARKLGMI